MTLQQAYKKNIAMSKANEEKLKRYLANSKSNTRANSNPSQRSLSNSGGRHGDNSGTSKQT